MNVKVQLRPDIDDKPGKVEFFNDVSYWENPDVSMLNLWREIPAKDGNGTDQIKIATIRDWVWIKVDE